MPYWDYVGNDDRDYDDDDDNDDDNDGRTKGK